MKEKEENNKTKKTKKRQRGRTVELPRDLYKRIRIASAKQDMSVTAFVISEIEKTLQNSELNS